MTKLKGLAAVAKSVDEVVWADYGRIRLVQSHEKPNLKTMTSEEFDVFMRDIMLRCAIGGAIVATIVWGIVSIFISICEKS